MLSQKVKLFFFNIGTTAIIKKILSQAFKKPHTSQALEISTLVVNLLWITAGKEQREVVRARRE